MHLVDNPRAKLRKFPPERNPKRMYHPPFCLSFVRPINYSPLMAKKAIETAAFAAFRQKRSVLVHRATFAATTTWKNSRNYPTPLGAMDY
jgi:hypothetical protein